MDNRIRQLRFRIRAPHRGHARTATRYPEDLQCHRLLGRAASESSGLRHVDGAEWGRQGRGDRRRMSSCCLASELIEEHARFCQVGRVEALGEPAVDLR
jgi:hypothetical protein